MTETVVESPKTAQIVQKYIALRDKKSEMKAAYDASVKDIDTAMERIEAYFMTEMERQGLTSMKTKFGTPYIAERTSATVSDWPMVLGFIRTYEAWDMLERRVDKLQIEEYRKEHDDLPPGINYRSERVVNVRRDSK